MHDLPPRSRIDLPAGNHTHVRRAEGPPGARTVVLLHGWTSTAGANWLHAFEPLAHHFDVVAPDLRGHRGTVPTGRRVRAPRVRSLEPLAEDVAGLLEALRLDRPIVVGWSMGAAVAQVLARDHGERVGGIVLCAAGMRFCCTPAERHRYAWLRLAASLARLVPPAVPDAVALRIYRRLYGDEGFQAWCNDLVAGHDWRQVLDLGAALGRFDSTAWLPGLKLPAAVVLTRGDCYAPDDRQRQMAAALGASVHEIDGGHGACLADPEAFSTALLAACSAVASAADVGGGDLAVAS